MKPPTRTDEQLLAAFAKGERSALAELAGRHEKRLLGLAAGLLGGRNDLACDAVQESWVRVIRFAGTFDGRSSFKTWVYRIAINQCRNLLSARPRETAAEQPTERIADASGGPERRAQTSESQRLLRAAVDALPEDKRMVLLLCYHQDMTHEQAAEILEVPLGTVKSRLHAALEQLRARLSPEVNA